LQDKVRLALHHEQPELLEHGVILVLENATPHFNHDVQSLVQCWGREVFTHPPYSPGLTSCDCWLFACVKEHCRQKRFELEEDTNAAITASFHHLSKDNYRTVIDHLPCRWEKCVDSSGDYIE
jgi:hypothetical protein